MVKVTEIKIVLLNIEGDTEKVRRQYCPPFGILTAATVLKNHNIEVTIKHLMDCEHLEQTLLTLCKGALAVGFSTMTSSNLLATLKASRILKKSGHYVFWGGIHATLLPEISLQEMSVDAVLRGEAESNLFEFVGWLAGDLEASKVKGLCYRLKDGSLYIDDIPNPVEERKLSSHLFESINIEDYLKKETATESSKHYIGKRMLPFMTSKGCPRRCAFCYNSVINGHTWRGYDLKNVFYEMDWLILNYNIEGWLFYDDNLFANPDRAWKILEKYNMPSSVEVELSTINRNFLQRAKSHNINRLFIGIESGSDVTLRKIRKGTTVKMIKEKVALCNEFQIPVDLSFMILFPNEEPSDLSMTFNLIDELSRYSVVKIDSPKVYNPYPYTDLYKELQSSGWVSPKSNEEWAKYERHVSPLETGFNLETAHLKILEERGFI